MKRLAPLLLLSFALHAQTAYLVKDINTSATASPSSSKPTYFFKYGSRVVFSASTPSTGVELWSTDGTAAGTSQIANINPGFASSTPWRFAEVNGTLVFNARDSRGEELWMSDGTTTNTRLMADILGGSGSSSPGDRIVYRGSMFFSAYESVNGRELWITDGTPAGTRLFKDLRPGNNDSEPHSFVLFNDSVYFFAANALWKTDGTEAGTVVVKDGVYARDVVVAGPRIFFDGSTAAAGNELWVSDGTEAGTRMIADVIPGSGSAGGYGLTAFGDRVLFSSQRPEHGLELWISDGTVAGTHMVRDIWPGVESGVPAPHVALLGGTAFFQASLPDGDAELWKTDGTEAGTMLVRDIEPGSDGSYPAYLIAVGGKVFFIPELGTFKQTLWMSDGTAAGTHPVKSTDPKPTFRYEGTPPLTNIDGIVYFSASNAKNGYELWKSDGTDAGTVMIANIAPDSVPSSAPQRLTAAGDWIYFDAWDGLLPVTGSGVPYSLWRSDGTSEGTLPLGASRGGEYKAVGRSLTYGYSELWISDGTPESTRRATEFTNRFPAGATIQFALGDTVLVTAGGKLWATKLAPGAPAVPLGTPVAYRFIEVMGRAFYFSQPDSSSAGMSLRVTDGTPAGTSVVASSLPHGLPSDATVMGGHLYFTAGDGTLWKSDGSTEGTVPVAAPQHAAHLTAAGRNLFFSASSKLWVTDGATAARELPNFPSGDITAAGDRVVFTGRDAAAGDEIWTSDGTVEGTRLLRDIRPGEIGSSPSNYTSAGAWVYFTAYNDTYGTEVWITDGTAEGTTLAADVQPGSVGSTPRELVRAGERIFFTALTTATGHELWALPLPAGARIVVDDVRVAEGNAANVARFTVRLTSAATQPVTVEYSTSNGTASSGSDYDAASGTLTFAAGETSKHVDVVIRGDAASEGTETFFLTLRNAAGAVVEKGLAMALLEDDDRSADLALAHDFTAIIDRIMLAKVTNRGPAAATGVSILATATPADRDPNACATCRRFPPELASGSTTVAYEARWFGVQQYSTLSISARESDPNPSDNAIGWTSHDSVAMDALYLTAGGQANVWFQPRGGVSSVSAESSDPSVVSVPASVALPNAGPATFVVRGLRAGSSTIRIFTSAGTVGTLDVAVYSAGVKPRFPGAINESHVQAPVQFDQPLEIRIDTFATAPFTGRSATGLVTISDDGREAARLTLTAVARQWTVPVYLSDVGLHTIKVDYAGDDNFMPSSKTFSINAIRGEAALEGIYERNGTTVTLRVRVTGSPAAAPTGTIGVSEPAINKSQQATLAPTTAGVAEATIILTDVTAGAHTLVLTYSGDDRYNSATQQMRILERRRAVRH